MQFEIKLTDVDIYIGGKSMCESWAINAECSDVSVVVVISAISVSKDYCTKR